MRGLLDFFRNLLPAKETHPTDLKIIPNHVAVIMDGNGRWAREKGLPVFVGHKKGGDVARRIAEYAAKMGVSYLTLYAFSSENWHRDPSEVNGLMNLLRNYLQHEVQPFMDLNIRLQVIGDRESLPVDIQHLIEDVESKTAPHTGLTLILAISYGSRQEVVHACRNIARQVAQGLLSPEHIDEACLIQHLYTKDIPDPDLFIRTSGEMRISNFLSWQMAYTELCFVSKYWPDFKEKDFLDALQEFGLRARRYGKSTTTKDSQDE